MAYQQDLFYEQVTSKPAATSVVSVKTDERLLTKSQKSFNRLVRRVETLREKIKKTTEKFERALRLHEKDVIPRLATINNLQKELVRVLAPFLKNPRLKRPSDRELLGSIIRNLLNGIGEYQGGFDEEDLSTLADELNQPVDEAEVMVQQEKFLEMRSQMEALLQSMGVEVDLSDIDLNATEEAVAAKLQQAIKEASEKQSDADIPKRSPRRPTKKEKKREARMLQMEEARKRTLSSIYKQLAKTLHPDLEADTDRRKEKLALMQELTAAYRANDLHTLLRLELQWLHREESVLDRLTEEKLSVYNAVLQEQVTELENELESIAFHPRFSPLVNWDPFNGYYLDLEPDFQNLDLDNKILDMKRSLLLLRSPDPLKEVRYMLNAARTEARRRSADFY